MPCNCEGTEQLLIIIKCNMVIEIHIVKGFTMLAQGGLEYEYQKGK